MQFSEKIIAARKGKGMSQEALAEAVGVSRQAVSKWETGEAKPDFDKLIGLCTALDLNMEYLCLDKEPALPPAPEKKRLHPAIVAAVLLAEAVLFFLLGMGACYLLFSTELSETPIDTYPEIMNQQTISEIRIVNISVDTVWNLRDEKQIRLSIMTNSMPEGMRVQLLVENSSYPSLPAKTCDGIPDGNYYRATFPHTDGQYTITAILTLGDETKQFPLLEIDIQGSAYSYTELWK